jgi:hypothetical protein
VDERFVEAIVHKRIPLLARLRGRSGHVVLGQRLLPFSVWHQQQLQGIDSPFLTVWQKRPSSIQLFNSLFIATQICRLTPFDTPRIGWRDTLRRKLAAFRFYFRPGLQRPGTRLLRLLIEAAKFRSYMADYCSAPVPFPNKHSKPVQSPVNLYLLELYRRFHPGLSDRALWAKSPGEIAWANTASQEAYGSEISIMTRAREEAREEAIRRGAEATARAKKKKQGGNGHVGR